MDSFWYTARDFSLTDQINLNAQLLAIDGSWQPSSIDLNSFISNVDGTISRPHTSQTLLTVALLGSFKVFPGSSGYIETSKNISLHIQEGNGRVYLRGELLNDERCWKKAHFDLTKELSNRNGVLVIEKATFW